MVILCDPINVNSVGLMRRSRRDTDEIMLINILVYFSMDSHYHRLGVEGGCRRPPLLLNLIYFSFPLKPQCHCVAL